MGALLMRFFDIVILSEGRSPESKDLLFSRGEK